MNIKVTITREKNLVFLEVYAEDQRIGGFFSKSVKVDRLTGRFTLAGCGDFFVHCDQVEFVKPD